jgi:hypothetical protein
MSKGVVPEGPVDITVDGEAYTAEPGQGIASALVAGGTLSWRRTRGRDEARGVFCGIGVCFDCLVTLNGMTGVRACLVEARPGDQVVRERGSGHADLAI